MSIEPWLTELKPVQVKELKDSFETLEKGGKGHKSLKPERLTRAQAREVVNDEEDKNVQEEAEGTDFFDCCLSFSEK
jgi:cytoskeleton-associated protein 5